MSTSTLGLLVGIALGLAGAFGGFGAFVLVLVCAAIGFAVGRYVDGDLDVSSILNRNDARRR